MLDRKRKIINENTSILGDLNSSDDDTVHKKIKPETPDIDLILEAEDEQPTIDAIAKKITNNAKVKPGYEAEKKRNDLKCYGKSHVTKSGVLVPQQSMGPPCGCRKDVYCNKLALTEKQRQYIFRTYWGFGDSNKQFAFIIKFTKMCEKKLQHCSGQGVTNRDFTYRYFLPITEDLDGEKVRVCKKMFNNTLSSNFNIASIWKKYESRCGSRTKAKRVDDKIASVCEHFRILQHSKLTLLQRRAAGLYTTHIKPFGVKKMFSQYREWIDSHKSYLDKAQTLAEYEQILARNISQDLILTLQQGDRKFNPITNKNVDGKICIEIENIKEVNSETKVIFRPDDDFVEESNCESFHSNLSNELLKNEDKPKIDSNLLKNTVKEERDFKKDTASDESNNSDSDYETVASLKTKKSIQGRKSFDAKDEVKVVEFSNYKLGHIMGVSSGKQFLTSRGRLITLRPPCASTCKKKCFEKISEQQREFIFNHFWRLQKRSNQWSFLLQYTTRIQSKSFSRQHLVQMSPRYSYEYFLPLTEEIGEDSEKVRVCQTMFIRTLAISASNVTDSWERETGELKDKRGVKYPWMDTKASDKQDLNENANSTSVTERKYNETNNFNVQEYTLRKDNVGDKSIDDIELDNTHLDFIYRAMPWEEYLNAVSLPAKGTKEEISDIALDSFKIQEENGIKLSKKEKIQRNRLAKLARKTLRPPCSCARGCKEKIDEEQRLFIFNFFWALNGISRQWAFLVRFSERYLPKRPRTYLPSRRQFSFNYYLPVSQDMDGEKAPVCLKMMCNTLSIQNEIIRYAWLRYSKGRLLDKRGCHAKNVKLVSEETRNSIKDHVNYLQEVDPGLQSYKFPKSGWLKFKLIFRNYEQWMESSQYPPSCKPSLYRYRVLLYQALNLDVPPKWLKTVN